MTVSRLPNNDGGIQPTILTAKGDLLTATAASTVTNLPAGSNDQVLVADSTTSTGLAWKPYGALIAAGKNAVINGGMDFWQRGTSSGVGGYQTADRWYENATASTTFTQEATVVPTGSKYSFKMTAGATASMLIQQAIETNNSLQFAGQLVTVSAQVQASVTTGMTVNAQYSTSVDNPASGSWSTIAATSGGTGNAVTGSFTKISGVYLIPANAKSILFYITTTSTVANGVIVYIGQCQLELGSTATTFSRAGGSINGEETVTGSTAQDGILYSQNASSNPSGSGSNAWAGYGVAGKNAIINGGMDIWQRGTTYTGTGGYQAPDRFYLSAAADTVFTRDTGLVPVGAKYSLKATIGATAAAPAIFSTLETANSLQFAGQSATLSVQLATSTSTPVQMQVAYSTSDDVATTGAWTLITNVNQTTTPSLTRYSMTVSIPSTARSLRIYLGTQFTMATAATINWGNIQLELGSTATTFSRAGGSIGGELALCQRYCYQVAGTGSSFATIGTGFTASTTIGGTYSFLPVTMRTQPTISYNNIRFVTAPGTVTSFSTTGVTITTGSTPTTINLAATLTAATANLPAYLDVTNATTSYFQFSAEL